MARRNLDFRNAEVYVKPSEKTPILSERAARKLREKHDLLTRKLNKQVVLGHITLKEKIQARKLREKYNLLAAARSRQEQTPYNDLLLQRARKRVERVEREEKDAQALAAEYKIPQSLAIEVSRGRIPLEKALREARKLGYHPRPLKKRDEAREARKAIRGRIEAAEEREARKAREAIIKAAEARKAIRGREAKDAQALAAEYKIPQSHPTPHVESNCPQEEKVITVEAVPVQENGLSGTRPAREPISDASLRPTYDVFGAVELRRKREQAAFAASPNLEDDDEKDSNQEKEFEDINELDNTDTSTDFLEPTVSPNDDQVTLDDLVTQGSLSEKIQELNIKMAQMKPQKIRTIISLTIRKDTKMVKALKKLHNYRCQFPDCTALIPMDDGRFYVEVAHISPVAQGGQSILGNLLVLCPNHHKEFDHGKLTIIEQSQTLLHGILNEKEFTIQQLDYKI